MSRDGAVLVEVLAAVAILAIGALSTLEFVTSLAGAQARQREREGEMRHAERLLTATSLLTQSELEQRLGVRRAEGFVVSVARPEPSLFRIGVAPSGHPEAELISALIHREEGQRDGQP